MKSVTKGLVLSAALLLLALSLAPHAWAQKHQHGAAPRAVQAQAQPEPQPPAPAQGTLTSPVTQLPAAATSGTQAHNGHTPTVFTLRSGIAEGRMVYLGVGGDINGKVNP